MFTLFILNEDYSTYSIYAIELCEIDIINANQKQYTYKILDKIFEKMYEQALLEIFLIYTIDTQNMDSDQVNDNNNIIIRRKLQITYDYLYLLEHTNVNKLLPIISDMFFKIYIIVFNRLIGSKLKTIVFDNTAAIYDYQKLIPALVI